MLGDIYLQHSGHKNAYMKYEGFITQAIPLKAGYEE